MQEEQLLRKPEKLKKQMKANASFVNPGFDDDMKMGCKLPQSELWHLLERKNLEESPKYKLIQRQPEAQKQVDAKLINSMATHHTKMKNPENILRESMLEEATSPKPYISSQNRHDIEQSPLTFSKAEEFDKQLAQFESFFDRDEEQKRRNNSIAEWG